MFDFFFPHLFLQMNLVDLWSFDLRFPLLWLSFCQLVFVSVCVHTKQQGAAE